VGPFTSLDDLCRRVDLRTVNKRVLESLIKAGAMVSLGGRGALLDRLDAALESASRHQRDVAAGQGTLFDLFAAPVEPVSVMPPHPVSGDGSAEPAPAEDDVPRKERLRWEKELLGLYLSEHPLGDIAGVLPEYVTAYTGDLAEESDQARVTIGGIIQSTRRVVTRAGSTMLVATIEDLQGSVEVVVFPKVFTDTVNAWTDDAVVLVTGRVDRRDESAQILCDTVIGWDDAVRMGPAAFSAERDRLARARPGGWTGRNGNGNGHGNGHGNASPRTPAAAGAVVRPRGADLAPVSMAPSPQPVAAAVTASAGTADERETDDAPAPADAVPLRVAPEAASGTIAIGFDADVPLDALLPAIEALTAALRSRPGPVPVVIGISVAGATRQVRLPNRAEWSDELGAHLSSAAGMSLNVELRRSGLES
jgi:hypothetical protein